MFGGTHKDISSGISPSKNSSVKLTESRSKVNKKVCGKLSLTMNSLNFNIDQSPPKVKGYKE
jgi:hypothetical protein